MRPDYLFSLRPGSEYLFSAPVKSEKQKQKNKKKTQHYLIFRTEYLFSAYVRPDYLFSHFSGSEYLFSKSASPPPFPPPSRFSESDGRPFTFA